MLLLDAESNGFTTTPSRKSIDCSRAKVEKDPNYVITTEKKIFTNLKINRIS